MSLNTNHISHLFQLLTAYGHWSGFISFAEGRHPEILQHILDGQGVNGGNQADKQPDHRLLVQVATMHQIAEQYFKHVEVKLADNCMRCSKPMKKAANEVCNICGWDAEMLSVLPEREAKAITMASAAINTSALYEGLAEAKWTDQYQCALQASECLSKANNLLQSDIAHLEQIAAGLEKKNTQTEAEEKALEREIMNLKTELAELLVIDKNTTPLYQVENPAANAGSLHIKAQHNNLEANVKGGVKFPAHLILALTPANAGKHAGTGGAVCFVVLKSHEWQPAGQSKWIFSLTSIYGRVQPGIYSGICTYLEVNPSNGIIQFSTDKIVIKSE